MVKKRSNRLIHEKSPYLRQHSENPVDWYPWGEEAFEEAKKKDKPIFLSIGYSTCHWCHVMAHESFEDPEVAKLMNDAFISIKVDREERPDVDGAYMTAAQIMTGSGGWPLTIVMDPHGKPFFAATYIPKNTRQGRVGMLDLIPKIKELWDWQREKAVETAENMTDYLQKLTHSESGDALGRLEIDEAYEGLRNAYDNEYAGFGTRPKFPTPHNLLFLLRYWKRSGKEHAKRMALQTLERMARGGIFDQLGYGFHRYSTDRYWLLPHFEKMLYDQALHIMAYTEGYKATSKVDFKETVDKIIQYVTRDMLSPEGVFYSAEDADSEGEEGKYYVWGFDELNEVLDRGERELASVMFNIDIEGNFLDEATGRRTGRNILYIKQDLREISEETGEPLEELERRYSAIRDKLLRLRGSRVRPGRDDKILTDWNGLMIGALSIAGKTFEEREYLNAAGKAADHIWEKGRTKDGRLFHVLGRKDGTIQGFLDDYAFYTWGLLELYDATQEIKYLKMALEVNEKMLDLFWDEKEGGLYLTPADGEKLILRKKEGYDGATPSGNSVAMHNLIRLSRITGRHELEEKAVQIGRTFSKNVKQSPFGYTHMLSAVDNLSGAGHEVVIVGEAGKEDTLAMLKALRKGYNPNLITLLKTSKELSDLAEYTKDHKMIDNLATAYVCTNQACKRPTTDPIELAEEISKK